MMGRVFDGVVIVLSTSASSAPGPASSSAEDGALRFLPGLLVGDFVVGSATAFFGVFGWAGEVAPRASRLILAKC